MTDLPVLPDPITLINNLIEGLFAPFTGDSEVGADSPANPPPAEPTVKRGCVAADETLLAEAHLERLGRGFQGFGLLRESRGRLEKAAGAVDELGRPDLATELRIIAEELPQVRDAEAAAELASRLEPLADECWELGRNCGRPISLADIQHAVELAHQVREGKQTLQGAEAQLKEGNANASNGSANNLPEPGS